MPDYANRAEREARLARAVAKLETQQRAELYRIMGNPPKLENIPPEYWDEKFNEWKALLTPELEDIFIDSAHEMMKDPELGGLAVDEDEINERARLWAVPYALALALSLRDNTRKGVEGAVNDYEQSGQTPDDMSGLRKRIDRWFNISRAEAIAITEVTVASVMGETGLLEALAQFGIRHVDIWQTQEDERVCKICGPRHGKEQGDGWIIPPPAHTLCRCFLKRELRLANAND